MLIHPSAGRPIAFARFATARAVVGTDALAVGWLPVRELDTDAERQT